ncbi:unnamed protein product [Heterosigma akashiwo]
MRPRGRSTPPSSSPSRRAGWPAPWTWRCPPRPWAHGPSRWACRTAGASSALCPWAGSRSCRPAPRGRARPGAPAGGSSTTTPEGEGGGSRGPQRATAVAGEKKTPPEVTERRPPSPGRPERDRRPEGRRRSLSSCNESGARPCSRPEWSHA